MAFGYRSYSKLTSSHVSNHASPAQYPNSTTTKRDERAVVTSLYTDGYAVAVATLGHALAKVNTDARKVVIYLPERISKATICYLKEVGWELHAVDLIEPPDHGKGVWPAFIDQYTKLRVWTLDTIGIKAAVYLDADTHVRRNFDELFELPFIFAAVPDVFTDDRGFAINFNAGVMAFKPDSAVFADMLSKVESAHFDRIAAEQSYLNLYYGSQVLRLPHVYNGNLAIKWRAAPYWNAIQEQLRIIHYTVVKPFDGALRCARKVCTGKEVFGIERHRNFLMVAEENWGGAFKEEVQEWGVVFEEMMEAVGDRCLR
jgi:alpha-N-acetylglucosamine transferase